MTAPRPVAPGATYLLTRRTTLGLPLLENAELALTRGTSRIAVRVHDLFLYLLGRIARRTGIVVLAYVVHVDGYSLVCRDPRGRIPRFLEHLHGQFARWLLRLRGKGELLWAPGQPDLRILAGAKALTRAVDGLLSGVDPKVDSSSHSQQREPVVRRLKRPGFLSRRLPQHLLLVASTLRKLREARAGWTSVANLQGWLVAFHSAYATALLLAVGGLRPSFPHGTWKMRTLGFATLRDPPLPG